MELAKIKATGHSFPEHADKIVTPYPVGLCEGDETNPSYMGFMTDPPTYSEGRPIIWGLENFIFLDTAEDSESQVDVQSLLSNFTLSKGESACL